MRKRFVHPALLGPLYLGLLIWQLFAPALAQGHADLAGTLAGVVHAHRFHDLMVATEGALQETLNG